MNNSVNWYTRNCFLLLLSFYCFHFVACIKPDEFPPEPRIFNISLNKPVVGVDEVFSISIAFEDGDGDIGAADPNDPNENQVDAIFVQHVVSLGLDSVFTETFTIPFLTPEGNVKAISGEIAFDLSIGCCRNPDASPACTSDESELDTNVIAYDVYIVDRSGNQSNVLRSPEVSLRCP